MSLSTDENHIIVNYHYVEDPRDDLSGVHPCTPKEFERQVKFLSENYKIVSVGEVLEATRLDVSRGAKPTVAGNPSRFCAITFDDGLQNQFQYAAPILEKYGATATFFVITSTFSGTVPSAHKIHVVLSAASTEKLIDMFNEFLIRTYPDLEAQHFIPKDRRITMRRKYDSLLDANFKETLIVVPSEVRDAFLIEAFDKFGLDESTVNQMLFMKEAEISDLASRGFFIENHTHEHGSLEQVSVEALTADLETANSILHKLLGRRPTVISYPHGRFDERIRDVIVKAGLKYGVTIEPRSVSSKDDSFLIPRYDTNDLKKYINQ
ncbi:MAG: polysaccharide deacetylase family protein [Candidatus Paceibacterota bacterium]